MSGHEVGDCSRQSETIWCHAGIKMQLIKHRYTFLRHDEEMYLQIQIHLHLDVDVLLSFYALLDGLTTYIMHKNFNIFTVMYRVRKCRI